MKVHLLPLALLAVLVIALFLWWRRRARTEPFLANLQAQLPFETVERKVLQEYTVYDGTTIDDSKLTRVLKKLSKSVGQSGFYSSPVSTHKEVLENVFRTRHSHTVMKSQYYGLVVGVVYDSDKDTTSYLAVDNPWDLASTVLGDPKYQTSCSSCRLYVPKWSYSKIQPTSLTVPDECLDIVNKWRDSGDDAAIKSLESSPCLSRENKIRFAGSVILAYLRLLEGSNWNFEKACLQYDGMLSNAQNPEVRDLLSKLNGVCSSEDILKDEYRTDLDPECVKAYNSWMLDGKQPEGTERCFSFENRRIFLQRLRAFLDIGSQVPEDYLDSYYRVVTVLHDISRNKRMRKVLRKFSEHNTDTDTSVTGKSSDKWKRALDALVQDYIVPKTIVVGGKETAGKGSLDSDALVVPAVQIGDTVVIDIVLPETFRLKTVIVKGCAEGQLSKFALAYEDPHVPGKFTDFTRVLYGPAADSEIKVNTLDNIVSGRIRLSPLDWIGALAIKIGFEGHAVQLDPCAQMMSVCKHRKALYRERDTFVLLQEQLNGKTLEISENNSTIVQLSDQIDSLKSDVMEKAKQVEVARQMKCPPAAQCLTPIALQPVWRPRHHGNRSDTPL